MTDALIEKVARAIVSAKDGDPDFIHGGAAIWTIYKDEARAAILAVLDHFSEPANVTSMMGVELERETFLGNGPLRIVAAVFRAARDEVSRG